MPLDLTIQSGITASQTNKKRGRPTLIDEQKKTNKEAREQEKRLKLLKKNKQSIYKL